MPAIASSFFDRPAAEVAPELLGYQLALGSTAGCIVETEAYAPDDAASHSFSGPTRRNRAMFGPPGHAYVYRSYGLHWCVNVVCAPGHAVLIRALQPLTGLEIMRQRRGTTLDRALCSGPGKLTQALAITDQHDGQRFVERAGFADGADFDDLRLIAPILPTTNLQQGRRIGISRAIDLPWRWGIAGSPWLSKKF
ncbi:putative 3-methyladenine DNA glycosylase [Cypionkella aquatica]|uniref:Putative 3-methyladenine DNA glycosylase n=1 Tax=Cypionkella aquatica TaxID=1756042 RepID=A0AA37TR65_9RHOB|nr:DNA-3-methyladenine glycosylase [Cypionkella aquatica]GLS86204.1 putative 3-methyladenine DNA glycosylase [Cypionkella aquatica]